MSLFAVVASFNPEAIRTALRTQYGANHYELSPTFWFVSDSGSTKDVADRLGITDGAIGAQGMVLKFDAYSGFAAAEGWQWIAARGGAAANG